MLNVIRSRAGPGGISWQVSLPHRWLLVPTVLSHLILPSSGHLQILTGTPTSTAFSRVPGIPFIVQDNARNGCKKLWNWQSKLEVVLETCFVKQVGEKQQLSTIRMFSL